MVVSLLWVVCYSQWVDVMTDWDFFCIFDIEANNIGEWNGPELFYSLNKGASPVIFY